MPLKSVDDYNKEKRQQRGEIKRKLLLTGVACPKCGNELLWESRYHVFSVYVYPPSTTRRAQCSPCDLTVDLEI